MNAKKNYHDTVQRQLQQYTFSKYLIKEYEEISLRARSDDTPVINGCKSDPTCKEALKLVEPDKRMRAIYDWVWAIESAYEMFKETAGDRAVLMEYLYGLNGNDAGYGVSSMRDELVRKLHISEPTLYRWKHEIANAVLFGAIQRGIINVYQAAEGRV